MAPVGTHGAHAHAHAGTRSAARMYDERAAAALKRLHKNWMQAWVATFGGIDILVFRFYVEVARKRRDSLRSIQESAAKEELESSVKEELQSTAKEELESTAKEGAGKSLTSGAERTTPYKAPDRAKPARRADEFYDDIFNRTSEEDDTL